MLKVGDKVKCISTVHDFSTNKTGTVEVIDKRFYPNIGVRFNERVGGHDLEGYCQFGYGQWLDEDELVLLGDEETDDR